MKFHPLADIFPLMQGEEFESLVEDIATSGLREPIVLHEQSILDGRNRWRACQDAGVEPEFVEYAGDNPAGYVVSLNLRRRHLDASQRAMVAARLATLRDGERSDRQGAQICVPTQDGAADMLNVGRRSVQHARAVTERGVPELVDAVDRGVASVSAASAVATLPPEQQTDIVAEGPAAIVEAAKAVHNHRAQSTGEYEWYTPKKYVESARDFLGAIDLDPASCEQAQETVRATKYFSIDDDGLQQEWHGRVWLNPPYKQPEIQQFMQKAADEYAAGRITEAIILTHNYTDTAWFHIGAGSASAICFTRGRIAFNRYDGLTGSPTQGQAFFYLGNRPKSFAKAFSSVGFTVAPL